MAPSQTPVFILLAEDNPADAGLVRRALEEHGVEGELIVIADGEKAIAFIQAIGDKDAPCPDLAIVDLNLPKKPGREVLESMRMSKHCRHIPVFILSSSDAQQDKADAARFGASRYIRKPSKLDDFLSSGPFSRRRSPSRNRKGLDSARPIARNKFGADVGKRD